MMKKALKRIVTVRHFRNGQRHEGPPTGVRGDLTGVWGDLSGVRGNLTGVSGDLDECDLSDAEREAGVNVEDLIGAEEQPHA